ncbi:hypothetical protein [Natronorubrum thiooxidans]|uniref:Uncharacterized protein n=1 Tax=Natronorubrum thiooxidans TaxID=308853 RepID=A0A1N7FBU9_9EURY|nr:hypothetical protein [Natronorubrum thiooxidans]SIR97831.1 hypothetical protein SAMN05421752_106179 [Natronorubrum thiooxidans]
MTDSDPEPKTDGGATVGFDQDELYTTVRTAVKDALLDILGTVSLLGFALLFVAVGAQALFTTSSTTGTVLGGGAIALGFVIAATALELLPSVSG